MMLFVSQRGFIWFCFDPDSGSRLQDLISPVGMSRENTPVQSACQCVLVWGCYGLSVRGLWFILIVSCHEENHPCSKSV